MINLWLLSLHWCVGGNASAVLPYIIKQQQPTAGHEQWLAFMSVSCRKCFLNFNIKEIWILFIFASVKLDFWYRKYNNICYHSVIYLSRTYKKENSKNTADTNSCQIHLLYQPLLHCIKQHSLYKVEAIQKQNKQEQKQKLQTFHSHQWWYLSFIFVHQLIFKHLYMVHVSLHWQDMYLQSYIIIIIIMDPTAFVHRLFCTPYRKVGIFIIRHICKSPLIDFTNSVARFF